MSDPTNFLDIAALKIAGVIGALCSLKYIKGAWHERLAMVVFAIFAAYHGSPYVANKFEFPEGVAGLLIGFLAAAVADKMMETVQSNEVWVKLRAKAGL